MNVLRRAFLGIVIGSTAGFLGAPVHAAFVPGASITDPGLSGVSQFDDWTNAALIASANPGYGNFPGSAAWPGPIQSNQGGDAGLFRTAGGGGGGPFPLGGSVYFGGFSSEVNTFGGTLAVQDSTPVANLANIVFQIQIAEATTYDFFNHAQPVLSYNGGSQSLAATYSVVTDKIDNGTFPTPDGPASIYINTYLLQWDLSGSSGVTDFSISFSGAQHAQLYALRLDQSDVYTSLAPLSAVPEPTSVSLLFCGLAAIFFKARKRR